MVVDIILYIIFFILMCIPLCGLGLCLLWTIQIFIRYKDDDEKLEEFYSHLKNSLKKRLL